MAFVGMKNEPSKKKDPFEKEAAETLTAEILAAGREAITGLEHGLETALATGRTFSAEKIKRIQGIVHMVRVAMAVHEQNAESRWLSDEWTRTRSKINKADDQLSDIAARIDNTELLVVSLKLARSIVKRMRLAAQAHDDSAMHSIRNDSKTIKRICRRGMKASGSGEQRVEVDGRPFGEFADDIDKATMANCRKGMTRQWWKKYAGEGDGSV
jgi:hypothetical protein